MSDRRTRRPLSAAARGRRGGKTTASRAFRAEGTAGLRRLTSPARIAYWRRLGAEILDDGTFIDCDATRIAKHRCSLILAGKPLAEVLGTGPEEGATP
jgi:hypothetical protein